MAFRDGLSTGIPFRDAKARAVSKKDITKRLNKKFRIEVVGDKAQGCAR